MKRCRVPGVLLLLCLAALVGCGRTLPSPDGSTSSPSLSPEEKAVRAKAWLLGHTLSVAALGHSEGAPSSAVDGMMRRSRDAASFLGVSVPPLPPKHPDATSNSVQALRYLLDTADDSIGGALRDKHGEDAASLFETSLKTNTLLLLYAPGGVEGPAVAGMLQRNAEALEIPVELWRPVMQQVEARASFEEVKLTIIKMQSDVYEYLSPPGGFAEEEQSDGGLLPSEPPPARVAELPSPARVAENELSASDHQHMSREQMKEQLAEIEERIAAERERREQEREEAREATHDEILQELENHGPRGRSGSPRGGQFTGRSQELEQRVRPQSGQSSRGGAQNVAEERMRQRIAELRARQAEKNEPATPSEPPPAPTPLGDAEKYLRSLVPIDLKIAPQALYALDHPFTVGGVAYDHGLLLHPPTPRSTSHATYQLDGGFVRLKGAVAVADHGMQRAYSPLTYRLIADGKEIWTSQTKLQECGSWEAFDVDLTGVNQLTLSVTCPGDHRGTRSVWLDPKLTARR